MPGFGVCVCVVDDVKAESFDRTEHQDRRQAATTALIASVDPAHLGVLAESGGRQILLALLCFPLVFSIVLATRGLQPNVIWAGQPGVSVCCLGLHDETETPSQSYFSPAVMSAIKTVMNHLDDVCLLSPSVIYNCLVQRLKLAT